MSVPDLGVENSASRCLRCASVMEPGFLHVQQQAFPIEWIMQVAELNGPDGRNVYGWGADAKRSSEQRRQVEASRRRITAKRCTNCGMVELNAT